MNGTDQLTRDKFLRNGTIDELGNQCGGGEYAIYINKYHTIS